MSELKRNIVSNFKRYTDGKNKVEYIVKLAMYSALAFVLYNIKFPLPFMFPSFLDIQISELPALIAGFSMGPISGCLVIIIQQQKEQKNRAFGACRRLFDGNGYVDYRQPFYLDSVLCRGNVQGKLGRLT